MLCCLALTHVALLYHLMTKNVKLPKYQPSCNAQRLNFDIVLELSSFILPLSYNSDLALEWVCDSKISNKFLFLFYLDDLLSKCAKFGEICSRKNVQPFRLEIFTGCSFFKNHPKTDRKGDFTSTENAI